jgi:hypothetical protein
VKVGVMGVMGVMGVRMGGAADSRARACVRIA